MTIPDARALDRDDATPRKARALEVSAGAAEGFGLGFHLGAALERIVVAAHEGSEGEPRLREATWLIERYLTLLEAQRLGADVRPAPTPSQQTGGTIATYADPIEPELPPDPWPPPLVEDVQEPSGPVSGSESEPVSEPAPEPTQELIVHELPSVRRELV